MIERLLITLALICLIFASCSLENKGIRLLRAHTINKQGVGHAGSAVHAERYCRYCHGTQLSGGTEAQPSCYQCHGQHWAAVDAQLVFAPASHSLDRGGYLHHEALDQVASTCGACHGADLTGTGEDGPPSCFMCHEQTW